MRIVQRLLTLTFWTAGTILLLSIQLIQPALAQNFTGADAELLQAAEQSRIRSATFWMGRPFSSPWSSPCVIQVSSQSDPPSGTTRFQFANGEVFGWNMVIRGSRHSLECDVIPHEVDHMVRASILRRPIPRWLDEGCASLMESAETHRQLRESASRLTPGFITSRWLDSPNYPASERELRNLYSAGFVIVELLLERGGPQRLLQLQHSRKPVSQGLVDLYQLDQEALRAAWQSRVDHLVSGCQASGCTLHHSAGETAGPAEELSSGEQELTIWTSRSCVPCRRFWEDFNRDHAFRNQLQLRFRLRVIDLDLNPQLASAHAISSVPCFEYAGNIVRGYQGPQWLIDQLACESPIAKATSAGVQPEGSSTADEPPVQIAPVSPALNASESDNSPTQPIPRPVTSLPVAGSGPVRRSTPFLKSILETAFSTALHFLPMTGIVGGSLATGGVGGIALTLLSVWIRHRWRRRSGHSLNRVEVGSEAPFPRQLDEARELLELRQSEGRVAALDAIRGMFLDDELDKLCESQDPATLGIVNRLRTSINRRVDEVAPLSTKS